ncbi:MAG: amidohydrolase family protein [Clostridiales bacterium]|nr:amidohydrolase family protein [Clostridiales bacterium]
MPRKVLLESMQKYGVNFSLTSNCQCVECDRKQRVLPRFLQRSQIGANLKAIEFARKNREQIGALIWCKPRTARADEAFAQMIAQNRDVIYGLKFHPYYSGVPFDDERTEAYLQVAERFGLAVLVHTATEDCCTPQRVYNAAKRHPKLNFVMGHMGLGSDNREAMALILSLPNLFGDTCWVRPEQVLWFIQNGGEDKIMFGTDNTIDGADTLEHEWYREMLDGFPQKTGHQAYEKLTYRNAQRVFGIRLSEN